MKNKNTYKDHHVKLIMLQLIGDIAPIGESEHDEDSYSNLEVLSSLFNELFKLLITIEYDNLKSKEFSRRKHGEYAKIVLDTFVKSRNSYWEFGGLNIEDPMSIE